MTSNPAPTRQRRFTYLFIGIAILIALGLYFAKDVFALTFLGVLFGVFLVNVTYVVKKFIPLAYGWVLAIVLLTLIAAGIGSVYFFGTSIEQQLDKTSKRIDQSTAQIADWLDSHPTWRMAIGRVPFSDKMLNSNSETDQAGPSASGQAKPTSSSSSNRSSTKNGATDEATSGNSHQQENSDSQQTDEDTQRDSNRPNSTEDSSAAKPVSRQESDSAEDNSNASSGSDTAISQTGFAKAVPKQALGTAGKVFSIVGEFVTTSFGLLANVAVIIFVGIFIATDPQLYRDGVVKLLPTDKRERAAEVMDKMGLSMFNWLNGRFFTMLLTGLGMGLGLWLLNVPLAFVVAAITALLTFIPNIGGIIGLALAMLMGLSQGPTTVLWVVLMYSGWQLIESNILTPLIQQQKTSIPPALLITFQLLMGAMLGFLGLLIATPLLAATLVFVKEIWIHDVLGDDDIQTPEVSKA